MTREEADYSDWGQIEEKNEKIQVMKLDDIGKNAIHGLINGMDAEPEFAEVTGTDDVEIGDILYCKETRCYYMVTAKDRSSITILNYAGNTYVHSIYDPHRTYFKTTLHVGSFEHILNELERLSNE